MGVRDPEGFCLGERREVVHGECQSGSDVCRIDEKGEVLAAEKSARKGLKRIPQYAN